MRFGICRFFFKINCLLLIDFLLSMILFKPVYKDYQMTLTGKESVYTIQSVVYVVVDDILKTNKQVIFLGRTY